MVGFAVLQGQCQVQFKTVQNRPSKKKKIKVFKVFIAKFKGYFQVCDDIMLLNLIRVKLGQMTTKAQLVLLKKNYVHGVYFFIRRVHDVLMYCEVSFIVCIIGEEMRCKDDKEHTRGNSVYKNIHHPSLSFHKNTTQHIWELKLSKRLIALSTFLNLDPLSVARSHISQSSAQLQFSVSKKPFFSCIALLHSGIGPGRHFIMFSRENVYVECSNRLFLSFLQFAKVWFSSFVSNTSP